MSEEGTKWTIEYNPSECPISSVVVYSDRAEIFREVSATLKKGETEILISGVSPYIDQDSIRVIDATGKATILEVSSSSSFLKANKQEENVLNKKKETVKLLDKQIKSLSTELERINKKETWIVNWSKNIMKAGLHVKDSSNIASSSQFSKDSFEKSSNFMKYYGTKLSEINSARSILTEKKKNLETEKDLLSKELLLNVTAAKRNVQNQYAIHNVLNNISLNNAQDNFSSSQADDTIKEITVNVRTEEDQCKISFRLVYIVFRSSWSSCYDVRVTSGEKKLDLIYYGNITNNTSEDWSNVSITLSTAQPSVAGKPPQLQTKFVKFKEPVYNYNNYSYDIEYSKSINRNPLMYKEVLEDIPYRNHSEQEHSPISPPIVQVTEASTSVTSTTFSIPRKATIESDNKSHKVTVMHFKLTAKYTYMIMPKKSPHVYIKATIKNKDKKYPFLPGPINVFMDGNFFSKSGIPMVNAGESFVLFFGVDQSIKFDYLPIRQQKETVGIMVKTNKLHVHYNTIITNNKDTDVTVFIYDNLPKSNDTSIKVNLLNPVINENEVSQEQLSPLNNIEWERVVPAGKKIEVPFQYTVEYPNVQGKEIEGAY
eukprot:TRINITY_DN5057_c0_g1_i1.p1 TRINITY_DN5057_c0_g1~~TRINITY_DN5057_c0_g1_i1.p1  ORF type:complete len:599 (-),score=143.42 TRINITY_DN5057_c0_g1_i1:99-1895(-)